MTDLTETPQKRNSTQRSDPSTSSMSRTSPRLALDPSDFLPAPDDVYSLRNTPRSTLSDQMPASPGSAPSPGEEEAHWEFHVHAPPSDDEEEEQLRGGSTRNAEEVSDGVLSMDEASGGEEMGPEETQDFWAGMEQSAGVRSAAGVRLRRAGQGDQGPSRGGGKRTRQLTEDEKLTLEIAKQLEDALESQGSVQLDYQEVLVLLLIWSMLVLGIIQFSGYHEEMYLVLKPVLAILAIPTVGIIGLYLWELQRSSDIVDSAVVSRDQLQQKLVKRTTKRDHRPAPTAEASPLLRPA